MLIADGGGGSVYRLHPPGGGVLPAPKPTPRPHSLDAGPRPTLGTPQVDPRILRAEGISRTQFMQQQAVAHQREAVAEQQRAQQARQRADESQQQAEVAAARAREHGSKENKALAKQWGKQARDDELNALRCEADANFTGKQAALEKSKLKDMQEGHASEPSRETQAAQVEADSAASTVSLLYDTPAGEADPLKTAGQTTHKLAKAEKWGEWQGAVQEEIRIAGLRALAKGEDPQAAMRERARSIERRDVDGMSFTLPGGKGKPQVVSGEDLVQEQRDAVLAEDPSQAALNAEYLVTQKAWQPLIGAARKKATQADDQVKADKKALADAPGGLKRDGLESVAASKQAAAEAGENLAWWESRTKEMDNGYQQRQADQDVHRTEVGYQVALAVGDPASKEDQTAIANAKDARDRALGDQVLARSEGKSLAANVDAQGATADLDDAWVAYGAASADQVPARTVTQRRNGKESTQTVYPEGYDKTFWAVPGSEEGKNVHLGDDGKYYYVSGSDREELNPAAARVWTAHDKVHGRKENGPEQEGALARQKQAGADFDSTQELLGSDKLPSKLDPMFWERRTGEIEGNLSSAEAGVAEAQRAITTAETYGGAQGACNTLIANLGEKVKLREQAKLQVNALHAVQRWRASPGDKSLLDAAGRAVAQAGPPLDPSASPQEGMHADLAEARKEKDAQQKIADTPGQPATAKQAALDKISGLDIRIEHDGNLIAQADAGDQRTGALYLNSQFSFGDGALDLDTPVRFSMRDGTDGQPAGLDAAPPLNYAELMDRATDDGEAKVLGDSGIRILHNSVGHKDVWEVPQGGGLKQYIYQQDGKVFITRTLAEQGQRLSPGAEVQWQRLWQADAGKAKADQAVEDSAAKVDTWNKLNPADAIGAPGEAKPAAPAQPQPAAPPGLDGRPVKVPTLWDDDLGKRHDTLLAQQQSLQGSPEGGLMPEVTGMLQAELDAVTAMQAAQDAHRALQRWLADPARDSAKGKELRDAISNADTQAIDKKDQWLALCRSHGLDRAKDTRSAAQTRHQEWKNSHPALVGTDAEKRSESWGALQQAEGTYSGLEQQHIQAATPAAQAAQKALIATLTPEQQRDPAKLHELFMAHPEVMAQPLINEHYLRYGSGPVQIEGHTHLNNEVSDALGYPPDGPLDPGMPESHGQWMRHTDLFSHLSGGQKAVRDAVVDEIEGIGGKHARVTVLPVVYSTRQSGVVKTALFKVEDGHGGAGYVDERGARYKDLDDYRANNNLPSTDCNIVMPDSDKVELDSLGNVKLRVMDGRTETGWETFKRRSHFDSIVGYGSLVLCGVMAVGSGGLLAPVAAGLLVAASAYGVTTSAVDLHNRAAHGLSINPFTDQEARLDWLNLAGSALAVPTLSAATRAGMVAWQATKLARATGQISGRLPWLAIRGVNGKRAGEAMEKLIQAGGADGAQAAALQGKQAFWGAPARVLGKPSLAVGALGTEENTRYMADNWEAMSSSDRWEQGGMAALNVVDMVSGLVGPHANVRPTGNQEARTSLPGSSSGRVHQEPGGAGVIPEAVAAPDSGHANTAAAGRPASGTAAHPSASVPPADGVHPAGGLHDPAEIAHGGAGEGVSAGGPGHEAASAGDAGSQGGHNGATSPVLPSPHSSQVAAVSQPIETMAAVPAETMAGKVHAGESDSDGGRNSLRGGERRSSGRNRSDGAPAGSLRAIRHRSRTVAAGQAPVTEARMQVGSTADGASLPAGMWRVAYGAEHPIARSVNPTGSDVNCAACAVSMDRLWANPAGELQAVPFGPWSLETVSALYGDPPMSAYHDPQAALRHVQSLPEGSRGFLILSADAGSRSHQINFRRTEGGFELVDAQVGRHVDGIEAPMVFVMETHRGGTVPREIHRLDGPLIARLMETPPPGSAEGPDLVYGPGAPPPPPHTPRRNWLRRLVELTPAKLLGGVTVLGTVAIADKLFGPDFVLNRLTLPVSKDRSVTLDVNMRIGHDAPFDEVTGSPELAFASQTRGIGTRMAYYASKRGLERALQMARGGDVDSALQQLDKVAGARARLGLSPDEVGQKILDVKAELARFGESAGLYLRQREASGAPDGTWSTYQIRMASESSIKAGNLKPMQEMPDGTIVRASLTPAEIKQVVGGEPPKALTIRLDAHRGVAALDRMQALAPDVQQRIRDVVAVHDGIEQLKQAGQDVPATMRQDLEAKYQLLDGDRAAIDGAFGPGETLRWGSELPPRARQMASLADRTAKNEQLYRRQAAPVNRLSPPALKRAVAAREAELAYGEARRMVNDEKNLIQMKNIQGALGSSMHMDSPMGKVFKYGALGFATNASIAAVYKFATHPFQWTWESGLKAAGLSGEVVGNVPNVAVQYHYLKALINETKFRDPAATTATDAEVKAYLQKRLNRMQRLEGGWNWRGVVGWGGLEKMLTTKVRNKANDSIKADEKASDLAKRTPGAPLPTEDRTLAKYVLLRKAQAKERVDALEDALNSGDMAKMREMAKTESGKAKKSMNTAGDFMVLPSIYRYTAMGALAVMNGHPVVAGVIFFHGVVSNSGWLRAQQARPNLVFYQNAFWTLRKGIKPHVKGLDEGNGVLWVGKRAGRLYNKVLDKVPDSWGEGGAKYLNRGLDVIPLVRRVPRTDNLANAFKLGESQEAAANRKRLRWFVTGAVAPTLNLVLSYQAVDEKDKEQTRPVPNVTPTPSPTVVPTLPPCSTPSTHPSASVSPSTVSPGPTPSKTSPSARSSSAAGGSSRSSATPTPTATSSIRPDPVSRRWPEQRFMDDKEKEPTQPACSTPSTSASPSAEPSMSASVSPSTASPGTTPSETLPSAAGSSSSPSTTPTPTATGSVRPGPVSPRWLEQQFFSLAPSNSGFLSLPADGVSSGTPVDWRVNVTETP